MIMRGGANGFRAEAETGPDPHLKAGPSIVRGLPDVDLVQRTRAIVQMAKAERERDDADALRAFLAERLARDTFARNA